MKRLALLALLCAGTAYAEGLSGTYREIWKRPHPVEWGFHAATEAVLLIDMFQTFDIKNHTTKMEESNFILGKRPSDLAIAGYFLGTAVVTTAVWYVLPREIRWIVDAGVLYVELPIIVNNSTRWGLTMQFPF